VKYTFPCEARIEKFQPACCPQSAKVKVKRHQNNGPKRTRKLKGHALTDDTLIHHRPILFRYALLHLRDADLAEDVVQETLLAALQSDAGFAERSSLRTWLIGILKHKIADQQRRDARETRLFEPDRVGSDEDIEEHLFNAEGSWHSPPKVWSHPENALEQEEFWRIYEWCQQNLPARQAEVFMLRELVGLEPEEICKEANLSSTNYWVTLHRARMRLRACLEIRWFEKQLTGEK
jgi:RNA polymerase sigma-70 factor (ECF subfamily)